MRPLLLGDALVFWSVSMVCGEQSASLQEGPRKEERRAVLTLC